jgi:hypothetical protein
MGSVEIDQHRIIIYSHIILYGNAASDELSSMMREEIETMWNEPKGIVRIGGRQLTVTFRISAATQPNITDIEIYRNVDPRNNYFRVEEFAHGNISFVDGLGCNSGYFKLENLYKGSTTAAHEYGHTLGLDHPTDLDLRGKGIPGIMYPRGTLVDPQYQYEPDKPAGVKGGTMHPMYRKVLPQDIDDLQLHRLDWESGKAILGEFTSVWHPDHSTIMPGGFT